MKHQASPRFWSCYQALPTDVQDQADRAYEQLKADPRHPSMHLKRIGRFWSVRVGLRHRALAVEASTDALLWVWIGTHAQYDKLLKKAGSQVGDVHPRLGLSVPKIRSPISGCTSPPMPPDP